MTGAEAVRPSAGSDTILVMSRVLLALAAGASAASLLIGLGLALTYPRLLGHFAGDGLEPSPSPSR